MDAREELRAVAACAVAGALFSLRCGSASALGSGQDTPGTPTGGASDVMSRAGNAGTRVAGASGRGAGGHSAGGAPSSGGVGPDGGGTPDGGMVHPMPVPGDCVA